MFYRYFIRNFLFLFSPEYSHSIAIFFIKLFFLIPGFKYFLKLFYSFEGSGLEKNVFGLVFKNPIGLAAGFDKNATIFNEFESFGFGFIEIGTVTPKSQYGNQKPRLFRLTSDDALINRMGFNNDGIDSVVKRLKNKKANIIIGGNIGKNKTTPNEIASSDYKECLQKIAPYVDYLVLNISSPNTPGLVELQKKTGLKSLLSVVQEINQKDYNKPLLIKISPDLSSMQIDHILDLVEEFNISDIIATNTSSNREDLITESSHVQKIGLGGLSGKPLFDKSKKVVSYINKKTAGKLPIIAVGGIMNSDDALEMLESGASLIQVYTGFIYKGPSLISDIKKKLLNI